jgi:hypothetical protein
MRSGRDRGDGTDVLKQDLRIREGIWGGGNLKIHPLGVSRWSAILDAWPSSGYIHHSVRDSGDPNPANGTE